MKRGVGEFQRKRDARGWRHDAAWSRDAMRRDDLPRMHVQHAIAARRKRGVVGDQNERGAALAMAAKQKFDDLAAGRFVEIAGRLVGDEDRWIGRERAGERDALLLAAGKLGRIMVQALRQARPRQFALGAGERVGARRRVRAGRRHFPAPSWSGSDGRPGTRCRCSCRESAPAGLRRAVADPRRRPSPSRSPAAPARSSPSAASICPSPTARAVPTASPRPIWRSMSRRIWTRAAPRPSDRLTPRKRDGVAGERMPGNVVHAATGSDGLSVDALRSYGWRRRFRQIAVRFVAWRCVAATAAPAAHADRRRSISSRWAIR